MQQRIPDKIHFGPDQNQKEWKRKRNYDFLNNSEKE